MIAIAISAVVPAQALGISLILPPAPVRPAGQTYSSLAARWWQWALSAPTATNPLVDTTGADCAVGQSGLVWYLAGTANGGSVTRSCTVPFGKTIVFPVVNAIAAAFPTDPADQRTESFLRSEAAAELQGATNLHAEVDGIPVPVQLYKEQSDVFSTSLPADNIYGLPAGQVLDPSVDAGYYVAVNPVTPGTHTIHWHGEIPSASFVVDVTYQLTVKIGG